MTALDVGAGIGRVTSTVLLPLFDDVVVAEPVEHFLAEAERAATAGEWREIPRFAKIRDEEEAKENNRRIAEWNKGRGKRAFFVRAGLQDINPAELGEGTLIGEAREGEPGALGTDGRMEFDAWVQ